MVFTTCSACGVALGFPSAGCALTTNHLQEPAVLLRDTPEDRERLILLLAMVPEPIIMRRGASTGTSEEGAVWGEPEEFTSVSQRADAIIAALREPR